ncbi:hypothetical protein [Coprothermobacter platensis]|uniref:hypothetical protein n=1 Tax=Coprothermobacter platensis TaxID=108819 RepID=UPI0003696BF2|nr:hypothetical protein [Coprothermobacter platensis]
MHKLLVALNNRLFGDASLAYAEGDASPGDLVSVDFYNRKLKGIVLKETPAPRTVPCKILQEDFAPDWLINRILEVLEEYPVNAYELLELAHNWKEEPRTILHIKAYNYVPRGQKEKELLKLLRNNSVELTHSLSKKYGKQIEELAKLGVLERTTIKPDSYAMVYARLVAPSLLVSNAIYEHFGNKPLPLLFWKKLLNPWTVEKLREEGSLIEETHVIKRFSVPVSNELPRLENMPDKLEDLHMYLRFLLEHGQTTLVVFPSLQMARSYARLLIQERIPVVLDSGGYTKFLQDAFCKTGGIVIGTPRTVLRPWKDLRHVITVFQSIDSLAIRTASQRIVLTNFVPAQIIEEIKQNEERTCIVENVKGTKDVDILAYLKDLQSASKKQLYLVNRLGFSTSIQCDHCGYIIPCPNCGVPMRYHRRNKQLVCHRCGMKSSVPDKCPRCGSVALEPNGIGIERLELQLEEKAFAQERDLSKNTIITTSKIFRYLPKQLFDDAFYVSADSDLATPVPIPEKVFLKNLSSIKMWLKPDGVLHIITRDQERINNILENGETIVAESAQSLGLPPLGHYIELELNSDDFALDGAVVWGPVPIRKSKTFKYFIITDKSPKEVLSRALTKAQFISFDV